MWLPQHESHCQRGAVTGGGYGPHSLYLHRQHLCQRRCYTCVREHLARFGLSVRTQDNWKMAHECWGWRSRWNSVNCGGSMVTDTLNIVTRSLCRKLVRHFPGCGWLRVLCRVPKRKASSVTKSWGDETRDNLLQHMISETVDSVWRDDPAHGDWCVEGQELNMWVNASSLVIGVVLERHETVLEEACWLRPENDT